MFENVQFLFYNVLTYDIFAISRNLCRRLRSFFRNKIWRWRASKFPVQSISCGSAKDKIFCSNKSRTILNILEQKYFRGSSTFNTWNYKYTNNGKNESLLKVYRKNQNHFHKDTISIFENFVPDFSDFYTGAAFAVHEVFACSQFENPKGLGWGWRRYVRMIPPSHQTVKKGSRPGQGTK